MALQDLIDRCVRQPDKSVAEGMAKTRGWFWVAT